MTQLGFRNARELSDALLFFARLENCEFQSSVEDGRHAEEYRTIVLASQAIYHTLVLDSNINLLSTTHVTSYAEVVAYDASVEFVVQEFGERLKVVREARGIGQTVLARTMLPANAPAKQITAKASYLSRIERENENVSLEIQLQLAKGLGFPSLSAFWIAIERAGVSSPDGLQSSPAASQNSVASALVKADPHAHSLPTGEDFERVIVGSFSKILQALDRIKTAVDHLARRLAAREQPATGPRDQASHRRRNPGKRTG